MPNTAGVAHRSGVLSATAAAVSLTCGVQAQAAETPGAAVESLGVLLFAFASLLLVAALLLMVIILHKRWRAERGRYREKTLELESERLLRNHAEEELRESLEDLRDQLKQQQLQSSVIEQTEDNVLITDSRRTIIYINPAFERSCGYSCAELKNQPLRRLRSDQHDTSFYRHMKETLDSGREWMGVIVNRGKNGIDFEIEGTISPIRDGSGAVTHYVAVGRNMSRFRKLERELHRMQKLDALGTLAGGIAHDFNNVLAAIMGYLELEAHDSPPGSRTHQRMEQALTACNRARDLVKQILTFSRQGEQRRKPLRLGPIVDDGLQMLRATLPTTISIELDLSGDGTILADAIQMHQVLVNLCTNAAHAMRNGGGVLRVSLSEELIDENGCDRQPEMRPGRYIRLRVEDSGEGIDPAVRERIFEPFFTTKQVGEGAGVGLSVVHGIVQSHGGAIRVESEKGKGTVFSLYFPKSEAEEEVVAEKPRQALHGRESIMVVDDESLVVQVAGEMLRLLGYRATVTESSRQALDLFRRDPEGFDLVITDLTMPELTGLELAAEMLALRRDLPIILSTGFADEGVQLRATAIGIKRIVHKPFTAEELAAWVREALDRG